jgi:hypothetical protein
MQEDFNKLHGKILNAIVEDPTNEELKKQLFSLIVAFNTIMKLLGNDIKHEPDV